MSRAECEMVADHGAVEIDMAERNGDLQQKRRQREICAAPFMAVNPSHAKMLMLYCYIWQEELLGSTHCRFSAARSAADYGSERRRC